MTGAEKLSTVDSIRHPDSAGSICKYCGQLWPDTGRIWAITRFPKISLFHAYLAFCHLLPFFLMRLKVLQLAVLKTAEAQASGGSNPSPSAMLMMNKLRNLT